MSDGLWLWVAAFGLAAASALLVLRPLARAGMKTAPAVALAAAPALIAFALYLRIGQPGLPDMPLAERGAEAQRHAELTRLAARLEAHLHAEPDDARGWRVLAGAWRGLGRPELTAEALGKAVQAEGGLAGAPADLLADHGEALMQISGGVIAPEALAVFRAALTREPQHPRAWYFLALQRLQAGDEAGALALWRGLEEALAPEDPSRIVLAKRIGELARRLGPAADDIRPAAPEAD